MNEKEINEKKEELKASLAKIGWSIEGRYPNEYIQDHEGRKTDYRVG